MREIARACARLRRLVDAAELDRRLGERLRRRRLPDAFLYVGEDGAGNWLALDASREFDVASRLTELLRRAAGDVAGRVPAGAALLAIGAGDGAKERLLLEALAPRGTRRYVTADVSEPMVARALDAVADLDVEATGVVAFCEDLPGFRDEAGSPALMCLLGNNVCNYEPDALLGLLGRACGPEDAVLFDCHLLPADGAARRRWREHVEQAYRSPANVRFNLGPLVRRGLDPDRAEFRLDLVRAQTPAGPAVRTRKEIRILDDASLDVPGGPVALRAGETFEMGFTYKYELGQVRRLLARHGFEVRAEHADPSGEYVVVLAGTGGRQRS